MMFGKISKNPNPEVSEFGKFRTFSELFPNL